jgi:hypothetical protein
MRVLFLYTFLVVTSTVCSALSVSKFDHYAKLIINSNDISVDAVTRHLLNVDAFRFCDVVPDNSTDSATGYMCQPTNYITALVLMSLVGIIFAGLALIFCVWYSIGYIMCGCCGCRKYPKPPQPKRLLALRILSIIILALSIAGMVLVLVGNASVTQSLQAFGATMTQTAVRSQQRVDRLSAVVTQLPTTAGPPFDLSAELVLARQGASILTQQTRDSNTSILEYNAFREGFVYLIAFVPFVLLLFSLIAMYKYWRFYTLMAVVGLSTWLLFIWLTWSVHLACTEAADDVCYEARQMNDTSADHLAPFEALSQIVPCQLNSTTSQDLRSSLDVIGNEIVQSGCIAVDQLCRLPAAVQSSSNPVVGDCSDQGVCDELVLADYATGLRGTHTVHDVRYSCLVGGVSSTVDDTVQCDTPSNYTVASDAQVTLQSCVSGCNNLVMRDLAASILLYHNSSAVFDATVSQDILPLVSCSFVKETFDQGSNLVCAEFQYGLTLVSAGCIILVFACLIGVIVNWIGWKFLIKP